MAVCLTSASHRNCSNLKTFKKYVENVHGPPLLVKGTKCSVWGRAEYNVRGRGRCEGFVEELLLRQGGGGSGGRETVVWDTRRWPVRSLALAECHDLGPRNNV